MTKLTTITCAAALMLASTAYALDVYSNERPAATQPAQTSASPFLTPVHEGCPYDVNGDRFVSVADAMFILQTVVGIRPVPEDCRPEDDD